MHANQTDVQRILGNVQQYVIPLFQRLYSWKPQQWTTLWQDLVELCDDEKPRNHFIGSIVTMPSKSVPEGVTKFILIDGQQRLTTLLVLLAAIRDKARKQSGNLANQVEDLLLKNRHQDGNDVYKLLPTQADREGFFTIMDGKTPPKEGQIAKAYEFFEKRLRLHTEIGLDKLHNVIRGALVLVSIVLDPHDNPYLIFESLNAKGEPLTQADLIRNFFFMRIHVNLQEKMYAGHWLPMQERLGDELTEYIRHFLMRDGRTVKQSEIYYTLKESVENRTESEIVGYLQEVSTFSKYYAKLLDPGEEPCNRIAVRLLRLNRFEATTTYPFLLNVYHAYDTGQVSEADFAAVLDVLESYLIRRFVCGVPTNALSKIFTALFGQASRAATLLDGVKHVLKDKDFPRDKDFRERFVTFKLYGGGDRLAKARLILERLELSFEHKEAIDPTALTIEHVMPQTPTDWWKRELGDDWEVTHEQWLDTVGNLTLTGYNPELSNSEFATKKGILSKSHVELNRYFADVDTWDEQAITKRGEGLADRATQLWPDFAMRDDDSAAVAPADEDEQEDVKLLITKVIDRFGGEVERIGSGNRHIYRVGDGKVINIKYSKRHADYYWFGVHDSLWEEMAKAGATHMVFVVGQQGFLTVPVSLVKEYLSEANVSRKTDGTVRHYHATISVEPKLEFFTHGKPGRIPLKPYFAKFDS
ncbi:MAG TPA: DUF262 domain-containing protein [Gemmataceae bacterium]|nr:DUF262 domain-containing protein [Gemmataceae bacterium]